VDPRDALREDLNREYYAIDARISDFDHRMLTVKGWAVTISLAGLGLGFQQGHYALFGLAALSAVSFWIIGGLLKRQQMRYYPRFRALEVAAHHLNQIELDGAPVSAPQTNWWWWHSAKGHGQPDSLPHAGDGWLPYRPRFAWLLGHVALPEALIAVTGVALFVLAATGVISGLQL
jgi:hypothetical protein